jgi:hypothetical protein
MTMGRIAILTLLVAATVDVRAVDACSCGPMRAACAAYWQLDAMFVGTVVAIEPAPAGAPGSMAVRFTVDQRGRGITGDSAVLYVTPQNGGNCGYTFRVGETYVVRAHAGTGGLLTTSMCSGTRLASQAADDIAFLREVTRAPRGGRVFGQVRLVEDYGLMPEGADRGPVGGARIRLTGARTTREIVTGADGMFDIRDLPAGAYQLAFMPPPGVGLPGPPLPREERVSPGPWPLTLINPSECAETTFRVRTDSQLTGRLLAPDGSPAADERVDLVAVAQASSVGREIPHVSARTDSDGRYTFAFVAPGQYLIGINLANPPAATRVDRRAYYPGSADVAGATAVTVIGRGARVELAPFRLPTPASERVIQGVVLWPDGRPAAGATVTLLGATSEHMTTEDGRFRYILPYGGQYVITASIRAPQGQAYSIRSIVDREARDATIEMRLRMQ